jgi:hypothetical protein
VKSASRSLLSQILQRVRAYAAESRWNPTSLVIDVDPLSLM